MAKLVAPTSRRSATSESSWLTGRNENVAAPRRSRRTASGASGCTETTTSAVAIASAVELGARLGVLLVGEQRVPAGVGLDRDLVAEPGQLADELGHQRDARLALPRLLGHRDPHAADPTEVRRGVSGNVSTGTWRGRPRGPSPRYDSTSVTASTRPGRAGVRRRAAAPSWSRRAGDRVRATVRCGRNRAPSTAIPARVAAARQPVASRSSSVRPRLVEVEARSRSPAPGRRSGRRRRRRSAVSNAVRRRGRAPEPLDQVVELPVRHARRGTPASRGPGRPGTQRRSPASRRTSRNSSRWSSASGGGTSAANMPALSATQRCRRGADADPIA